MAKRDPLLRLLGAAGGANRFRGAMPVAQDLRLNLLPYLTESGLEDAVDAHLARFMEGTL